MIVVDASVLTDFLLGRPGAVLAVEQVSFGHEHEPLHAPEQIELETLNAMRGLVFGGAVDDRRATEAVAELGRTRLACFPHGPLRGRVWELRHNLTAYDASYLALAELLDESLLLTADSGLATVSRPVLGDDRVRLVA